MLKRRFVGPKGDRKWAVRPVLKEALEKCWPKICHTVIRGNQDLNLRSPLSITTLRRSAVKCFVVQDFVLLVAFVRMT